MSNTRSAERTGPRHARATRGTRRRWHGNRRPAEMELRRGNGHKAVAAQVGAQRGDVGHRCAPALPSSGVRHQRGDVRVPAPVVEPAVVSAGERAAVAFVQADGATFEMVKFGLRARSGSRAGRVQAQAEVGVFVVADDVVLADAADMLEQMTAGPKALRRSRRGQPAALGGRPKPRHPFVVMRVKPDPVEVALEEQARRAGSIRRRKGASGRPRRCRGVRVRRAVGRARRIAAGTTSEFSRSRAAAAHAPRRHCWRRHSRGCAA